MFWLYVCSGVSIISNAVLTLGFKRLHCKLFRITNTYVIHIHVYHMFKILSNIPVMKSLDRAMGIKDPIARTKSGFQTYALSPAFDWLVTFNKHWFDWMIASSNQHQFQNPSKRVGSDKFKIQVTCFVIGFPILVAFPMLMFYDIICGICMPNSDTILESHILDTFKIFLFLVVYLIPSICSSWALLVTRTVFQSGHHRRHGPDFIAWTRHRKTVNRSRLHLSIHKRRTSLLTNQSDHVYRYNKVDAISFTLCWLPNYIVDISQPFVSQEIALNQFSRSQGP